MLRAAPVPLGEGASVEGAWMTALVAGRERAVRTAVADGAKALGRPLDGPRAGLLAAIAHGVAWTWGSSVDRRALRVGAAALEVANQLVFVGLSADPAPLARALHGQHLRAAVLRLLGQRRASIDRVFDRWAAGDAGREPIPESVLCARSAVALGVVAGDVDDPTHAALDALVTQLGLAWEARAGALTPVGERGAWRALGPTEGPVNARLRLAPAAFADALAEAIDALARPPDSPCERSVEAWVPRTAPIPVTSPSADPLDAALAAVVAHGPTALVGAARFLRVQGGKRLRPKLVLTCCAAAGGSADRALGSAAAVEWVHLASLVLDDVLDGAELRRGAPALHRATDVPFAVGVAGWLLLRVRALGSTLPDGVAGELEHAIVRLADGQADELVQTGVLTVSEADHHRVIAAKTGSLFAAACAVGARCAGADLACVERFRRFGHELGVGFQLVDDALDYTGALEVLGKAPGADLRAGKATLPLLLLRDRAEPGLRARLAGALGHRADPDVLRAVADGVCAEVLERARIHRDRALSALHPSERTPELVALADALIERDR